jgi:outer membrane lipoprotein SlyB
LLIETDSGNFISIIQEVGAYSFFKGQKVQIIKRNGKSRVIPFE